MLAGSIKRLTFRTLLLALNRHDANAPAQDRTQLGVAEFVNGAVVVDRRVDYLHGLAFEAIGDLLKRPSLLVFDRALDKLFGENSGTGRPAALKAAAITALGSSG